MPGPVRRKFSSRLVAAFLLVLVSSTAATDLLLTHTLKRRLVESLTDGLLAQSRLASLGLPASKTPGALAAFAAEASRGCACRATVVALDGTVLADSGTPPGRLASIENHKDRPEVRAAIERGAGTAIRHSGTVDADLLYAAVPYGPAGKPSGVLRLALPLDEVGRQVAAQRREVAVLSLWTMFAAALAAFWLSGTISRPVSELSRVAERLAEGDYGARLCDIPNDELGRLGKTMNLLAERVRGTVSALSAETAQLSAVLANMVEGVVAVDSAGKVLVVNSALAERLGLDADESRGKPFLEVLRNRQLAGFLEAALKEGTPQSGEARLFAPEERVFSVQAMPMLEDGRRTGSVAVLHDVTRLRRLEAVRRDFVANVSHELRTPLASIKGYVETLENGAAEDKKTNAEFLAVIQNEADRMSRLVDDLLELSAIESGQRKPSFEPLDPLEAAREAAGALRPLASRRKVKIEIPAGPGPRARADRSQLRQVLTNLLENAVKFNREGGTVSISAEAEGGSVAVRVTDDGPGIPAPDLPRLFERFYRVDRARSRELGGTGLGLAIVKHIIEAHGGSVAVESVEGRGSSFRFALPAA